MNSAGGAAISVEAAERAAGSLLHQFRISYGAQVELELLAWKLGILVHSAPLRGAVARMIREGRKAIVTLSDALALGPRRQFTIAHELGHYLLHATEHDQLSLCTEAHLDHHETHPIEREANAFAVELLMPRKRWTGAADVRQPDFAVIRGLANQHRVSLSAAAIRFVELSPARCAVAFCQDGKVSWSAHSAAMSSRIEREAELMRSSLAWGFLQGHPMPDWPTRVPATAWVKELVGGRDDEVIEHCVSMPSLNAALSLVVMPRDSRL